MRVDDLPDEEFDKILARLGELISEHGLSFKSGEPVTFGGRDVDEILEEEFPGVWD